ncbi:MAG: phosphoenolpyruvate--protein phosphotransferase [Acidobacteriota bacterium]|nr:phosphoenolpyruvate--protein phosphotransferase [Acidobacteriota bacterium]MDQ7086745.1 phosphoenolpyruvate--protein phosphotransferase [Acidobacteriota bacterium]
MKRVRGIAVSHGIATGKALVISRWESDLPRYRIAAEDVRSELRRFWKARSQAREEIGALREKAARELGDKYAAIFDAHLMILDDRSLGRETMGRIRDGLLNAEWALAKTVKRLLAAFAGMEDPYIRERGGDVSDVHTRLQRILALESNREEGALDLEEDTVIVAPSLLPSDALWLHQPHIVAFVTEQGSRTSHTAILANALEIAAVLGAEGVTEVVQQGDEVIVDGFHGTVIVAPTAEEKASRLKERERLLQLEAAFEQDRGPVRTTDGVELVLRGNVEFPEEMKTLRRVGATGVGLYRSEFLFLTTAPRLPDEEQHFEAYCRIAREAEGAPVVIRTLDLGGEKYFHDVLESGEANPVMGLRAVRFCLKRPDIFRTQLRGLLLAAAEHPNIRVMVPMISGLEEWRAVRMMVSRTREELESEGRTIPPVPLGPMIEIPSAALMADALARESDFFSIGTNDLQQYTLAVDRGNRSVAYLNDPCHPAVLRLLRETILAARRRKIPISLCGEMASDPLGALTLLGMGLREFSCNPAMVSEIRSILRRCSERAARRVVSEAMELATGQEIRARLEEAFSGLLEAVLGPSLTEDTWGEDRNPGVR